MKITSTSSLFTKSGFQGIGGGAIGKIGGGMKFLGSASSIVLGAGIGTSVGLASSG